MNIASDLRYVPDMLGRTTALPISGSVDVWPVQLDHQRAVQDAVTLLSPNERARLARRRGLTAHRFAVAHSDLRRIVATYEGVEPELVDLHTPYNSAPRAGATLTLSLSYSDDLALVAVATAPVGIDLESVAVAHEAGDDLNAMAAMTLSEHELALFQATPKAARPASWVRAWTRKEAWLKANGRGIGEQSPAEVNVLGDVVGDHTLVDLELDDDLVGAVALNHRCAAVSWKELHT